MEGRITRQQNKKPLFDIARSEMGAMTMNQKI